MALQEREDNPLTVRATTIVNLRSRSTQPLQLKPSQVYGPSRLVVVELKRWHRSKGSLMNLRYSVISTGNNETKVCLVKLYWRPG